MKSIQRSLSALLFFLLSVSSQTALAQVPFKGAQLVNQTSKIKVFKLHLVEVTEDQAQQLDHAMLSKEVIIASKTTPQNKICQVSVQKNAPDVLPRLKEIVESVGLKLDTHTH